MSRSQPITAQRLLDHIGSDHLRGCMGRQYSCTCEYDAATEGLLAEAAARIHAMESALQISQELFTIMVNPQDHPNTSVQHLWAQCKEIECNIRGLLQPKDGAK